MTKNKFTPTPTSTHVQSNIINTAYFKEDTVILLDILSEMANNWYIKDGECLCTITDDEIEEYDELIKEYKDKYGLI